MDCLTVIRNTNHESTIEQLDPKEQVVLKRPRFDEPELRQTTAYGLVIPNNDFQHALDEIELLKQQVIELKESNEASKKRVAGLEQQVGEFKDSLSRVELKYEFTTQNLDDLIGRYVRLKNSQDV